MFLFSNHFKKNVALILFFITCRLTAEPDLPLKELQLFVSVYHQIRERHINEVSDKTLFEYAIKGMLQNLDPHSDFLSSKAYRDLQNNTVGEFAGLGFEVVMHTDYIKVISVIDGSPASKAGIQKGDIILKINQIKLKERKNENLLDLLYGKEGSKVRLLLSRKGQPKPFEMVLTRRIIRVKSVRHQLLKKGFAYLKITQFQKKTTVNAKKSLKALKKKNKGPLKGLIIDLRNNPGGLLSTAISLSNVFLNKGLITYTSDRFKQQEKFHASADIALDASTEIVILVNGGTASSSEVFIGALQDHGRAIIAGTRTFGKGSIQSVLPVTEGRAIKLTTAQYYTPLGRSIQARGIKPDITIKPAKLTLSSSEPFLRESQLKGHIKKDSGATTVQQQDQGNLKLNDYQLYEAVNILQAISLANRDTGKKRNGHTSYQGETLIR